MSPGEHVDQQNGIGVTILITGASGFIGWHMARALCARGQKVRGLVRPTSRVNHLQALGVDLAIGDVTQPETLLDALEGVDCVYHLAGLTSAIDQSRFDEVNAKGCSNIAEACIARGVSRLASTSSLAAVGPSPHREPLTEDCTPWPVSIYGKSKLDGEIALRQYASRMSICIVRPPIVFGEHDLATLHWFQSIYRCRLHVTPGLGRRPLSIIHASDLAHLLILAAESSESIEAKPTGHGVYFAESEERPSYKEIGKLISASVGRRCFNLHVGPIALRLAGRAADGFARMRKKASVFSSDKVREALSGPWICSAAKATQLGFSVHAPLAERFLQTGRWYQDQGWL